jgi:hypothetical protein
LLKENNIAEGCYGLMKMSKGNAFVSDLKSNGILLMIEESLESDLAEEAREVSKFGFFVRQP